MAGLPEYIENSIAEAVEGRGLYLLEVIRRGHQNSGVLEVIVDGEQGVNLDALTEVSRQISAILDEDEDAIKGRYRLEVSTPGLDRPLEHDWQYRKNVGRLVKITWRDEEEKKRTELYRLQNVAGESLEVTKVKGGKGKKGRKESNSSESVALPFDRIDKVTVEPEI